MGSWFVSERGIDIGMETKLMRSVWSGINQKLMNMGVGYGRPQVDGMETRES